MFASLQPIYYVIAEAGRGLTIVDKRFEDRRGLKNESDGVANTVTLKVCVTDTGAINICTERF